MQTLTEVRAQRKALASQQGRDLAVLLLFVRQAASVVDLPCVCNEPGAGSCLRCEVEHVLAKWRK